MFALFIGTQVALEKNADKTIHDFHKLLLVANKHSESSSDEEDDQDEDEGGKNQSEEDQCDTNDNSIEDSNTESNSAGKRQYQPIEMSISSRVIKFSCRLMRTIIFNSFYLYRNAQLNKIAVNFQQELKNKYVQTPYLALSIT
jgi:hypothetical protein